MVKVFDLVYCEADSRAYVDLLEEYSCQQTCLLCAFREEVSVVVCRTSVQGFAKAKCSALNYASRLVAPHGEGKPGPEIEL